MALSAEFGDVDVQPPIRLATYLEQKISETNKSIESLNSYISSLEHTSEERKAAEYWLTRETLDLVRLENADVRLSHGKPTLARILLREEILDINHYANQCFEKGALASTRSLLSHINALREIRY